MAIVPKTNSCRADVILLNFPNSVKMDILYSADSQGRGVAKRESLTAVVMALTDLTSSMWTLIYVYCSATEKTQYSAAD